MTTFLQVLLVVWLTGAIVAWMYVMKGMHHRFVENNIYFILREDAVFTFIFICVFICEMLLAALACLFWPLQYVRGGTKLLERVFWGGKEGGR